MSIPDIRSTIAGMSNHDVLYWHTKSLRVLARPSEYTMNPPFWREMRDATADQIKERGMHWLN